MNNLHTRKSIGDKEGLKTCYVVEFRDRTGLWSHPNRASDCYSSTFKGAVILKNEMYRTFKRANKTWKRNSFRVSLYVRVEDKSRKPFDYVPKHEGDYNG